MQREQQGDRGDAPQSGSTATGPGTAIDVRRVRRFTLAIAALALVVYLPGVWWGVPHATDSTRTHAWAVDDETPLGTLAEIYNIARPDRAGNPGYPMMYAFMTTAASGPYLGALALTGALTAPSPEYPFGLTDPITSIAMLGLIAHVVTAFLGMLIVVAAWDAGRVTMGTRAGVLAALLALFAYPMVYYARTGNVDVPMLAFTALAFAAFVRCVVLGTSLRRYIALGLAVGFALGTKEAALGAFIGMAVVLILVRRREMDGVRGLRSWEAWRPLVWGLVTAFLALGAGSGFFVAPSRYITHLEFLTGRLESLSAGDTLAVPTFPYTLAGHIAFARQLVLDLARIMSWPGLLLAPLGTAYLLVRKRRLALLILPAASYILWMFLTLRAAQLRYMLPGAFLLVLAEVALIDAVWSARRKAIGMLAPAVVVVVVGMLALRATDLTWSMLTDTRYQAGRWIAEHASPGDRIDYFGASQKLPPMPAGVTTVTAAPYRGMYSPDDVSDAAVARILERWAAVPPRFVIAVPDHTSPPGATYSRSFPPQLFDAMLAGRTRWKPAVTFERRRLFPWLRLPPLDYPTVSPTIRIFERDPSLAAR
jgi:Dolichyl-phosphate-mannose-protein mannosyltransferase